MSNARIILIALTTIVSLAISAPTTNDIKAAAAQLECASEALAPLSEKYALDDIWFPVYFPIAMHINTFYGCQHLESQAEIEQCLNNEKRSSIFTLAQFLASVQNNNSDVAEVMHSEIISECGIELPSLVDLDAVPSVHLNKINVLKSIEHIACVAKAITSAVKDNEIAREWIGYNVELKNSVERLLACKLAVKNKAVCVIKELHTTIKVVLKFWRFLDEKKHITVFNQIKAEIQGQCSADSEFYAALIV